MRHEVSRVLGKFLLGERRHHVKHVPLAYEIGQNPPTISDREKAAFSKSDIRNRKTGTISRQRSLSLVVRPTFCRSYRFQVVVTALEASSVGTRVSIGVRFFAKRKAQPSVAPAGQTVIPTADASRRSSQRGALGGRVCAVTSLKASSATPNGWISPQLNAKARSPVIEKFRYCVNGA